MVDKPSFILLERRILQIEQLLAQCEALEGVVGLVDLGLKVGDGVVVSQRRWVVQRDEVVLNGGLLCLVSTFPQSLQAIAERTGD